MQFFWQHCQQRQPPKCRYLPGVHHILKTSSSAIFSVCHSQIPEVRPHSCDDLSICTVSLLALKLPVSMVDGASTTTLTNVHGVQQAIFPTHRQIHLQIVAVHSLVRMVWADFRKNFQQETYPNISQHIPTKFPRARSSIIAMRHDVTVEFVNSKFSEQVFGECFQHYFNFFSSADGLNCMFQNFAGHGG